MGREGPVPDRLFTVPLVPAEVVREDTMAGLGRELREGVHPGPDRRGNTIGLLHNCLQHQCQGCKEGGARHLAVVADIDAAVELAAHDQVHRLVGQPLLDEGWTRAG